MNTFDNEVKQRWGNTDAYKESKQKTADYSADKWNDVNAGLDAVLAEFAVALKDGTTPESESAKSLVKKLQQYITDNFYTCTDEILAGLGQMYVADDRFKSNIDKNGAGTAEFISEAIRIYCK
ncbi:MAG: TipAS antibiotic-recognition domain-containing protein [Clostridia bacterium]|nr:TipAS antibiotic-recognition domain-containing protein [Clostridia bacterium]